MNAGAHSSGTAFSVTPSGAFTLLYPFGSSSTDPTKPSAALLQGSDGNFYGNALTGGASSDGAIFTLTPNVALPAPVQLIAPASVTHGSNFTLSYSVANAYGTNLQACVASNTAGDTTVWTGAKTASIIPANITLTAPANAGAYQYSLTCGGTESGFITINVH